MSVLKNSAIAALDPESLCHSIYTELYNQFFNAQDRKDELHPYGVKEGDDTSIRLHNTAYGFAYAIAGAVEGGGSGGDEGGILLDYLKKTGGDMAGMLRADYGFEAGVDNHRALEVFLEDDTPGVRVHGILDLYGEGMSIGGRQILSYQYESGTLTLESDRIYFGKSSVVVDGELIVGSKGSGVYISQGTLQVAGSHVYHEGNANLPTVDWSMRNGSVSGSLAVEGGLSLSGPLSALYGVEMGCGGRAMVMLTGDEMKTDCFLSFGPDYGIRIMDKVVLGRFGESDIGIGGIGGDLLLGGQGTNKIKLLSNLMDEDGDYTLLSTHGAAYFPDSLTVRHNFGEALLSSYRVDKDDEGIVIHKRLRFGTDKESFLGGHNNGLRFDSYVEYTDPQNGAASRKRHNTTFSFDLSRSLYGPSGIKSESFYIDTDADFLVSTKPFEAEGHIGINRSHTRLTDGSLFFTDSMFLLAGTDGIKHYGNAFFLENISSEFFSSGFAGSGWAIRRNKSTGNTDVTVDELTVRKKMRVYELEVQKVSATNGSLWISHHCQGDSVERIS